MTQRYKQSIPVVRASAREYELAALVGDDAVLLGWNMDDSIDRSDLLGFAIKRTRRNSVTMQENECRWLDNHRRFALRSDAPSDDGLSTRSNPLQQFHCMDFDIEPGSTFTYSMVPVRGTPSLRYFEAPVSVTVQPQAASVGEEDKTASCRSNRLKRNAFVPSPGARESFRHMGNTELAGEIRRMTDQARSAVFLYSAVELPEPLSDVVGSVNSGRLLYGLAPGHEGYFEDAGRPHSTVHLSRPDSQQALEPLTFLSAGCSEPVRYTSALVTDPWSRTPGILLWSDTPRATPERILDTRVIRRDKRSAARLATTIFQAYAAGHMPGAGAAARRPMDDRRHLEPDGRWSNVYFSRHAASHKYREREIFAGRP